MNLAVIPNQANVNKSLGDFVAAVLPSGVEVFVAQTNRVPEPSDTNFVVMTPLRRERLSTNVDTYADALFTGSISGAIMTIDSVFFGEILLGASVFGIGITDNTYVTQFGTGTGGAGTYFVNNAQTFDEGQLAAGTMRALQPVQYTIQLDVHGPASYDNAHIISTMFRDEFGATLFNSYGFDLQPLYADDPKQIPFFNAEEQVEDRWVLEACLQVNQAVIKIPQQFFDKAIIGLIDVDARYPA